MPEAGAVSQKQRVLRLQDGVAFFELDEIAQESPVHIDINGVYHGSRLATPYQLRELALGYCLDQGVISSVDQVHNIDIKENNEGAWRIDLRCTASAHVTREFVPVQNRAPFCQADILKALQLLEDHQKLRKNTGSLHAAAWIEAQRLIALYEDIGRHNALDKLRGYMALAHCNAAQGMLVVSSRAGYEMVSKAAHMGVGCMICVSAPTTRAVALAERCNMTLIAFARPERQSVYSHPEYLKNAPEL